MKHYARFLKHLWTNFFLGSAFFFKINIVQQKWTLLRTYFHMCIYRDLWCLMHLFEKILILYLHFHVHSFMFRIVMTMREFGTSSSIENNWVFKTTISVHKFIRRCQSILIFCICTYAKFKNSYCRFNILGIMNLSFNLCNARERETAAKASKNSHRNAQNENLWK